MQSDFAQGFVNAMLGWMRSLAAAVANMFRTQPNEQPGSATMFDWFKDNWLGLLIALIIIGVAVDWIVWILRWRPHWLWFKKRRIVLDDEVRESEPYEPAQRFHSRALRYDDDDRSGGDGIGGRGYALGDDDWDYDEYVSRADKDYEDDFKGGFDDYFEEDYKRDVIPLDDDTPPDDEDDAKDMDDEGDYDDEYEDEYEDDYEDEDEYEDDFGDEGHFSSASDKKSVMSLFKKRVKEDDPFYISDDDYRELDDDFYAVVSEDPRKQPDTDAGQSRKARRRGAEAGRDGKV